MSVPRCLPTANSVRLHAAVNDLSSRRRKPISRGTESSNPPPSSRESRRLPDSDRQKWPKPERGRPNAISRGTHRCTAAEVWAGRPQRLAQRRDGSANPVQAAARGDLWVWAGAACAGTHFGGPFPQPGAKRPKRVLFGPRRHKGQVSRNKCRTNWTRRVGIS
jgi:hypothetical protein